MFMFYKFFQDFREVFVQEVCPRLKDSRIRMNHKRYQLDILKLSTLYQARFKKRLMTPRNNFDLNLRENSSEFWQFHLE